MKKRLLHILLLATLLSAAAVTAQDDGSDAEDGDSQNSATAPGAGDEPVSDDVFIPSEEVQAAEELTFPVDI